MARDPMKGQIAHITHQQTGKRVDMMLAARWAGLARQGTGSPYLLGLEPEGPHLFRDRMDTLSHLLIRPVPVIDELPIVERIVEGRAH